MVIDTSAIAAILFQEDDHARYEAAIQSSEARLISAVTRVELAMVIEGRKREAGRQLLERFMALSGIEVVAVSSQQAEIAVQAFRQFGKGRHPAALNIGDCFAYALAIALNESLLFKGNDFLRTDVSVVAVS